MPLMLIIVGLPVLVALMAVAFVLALSTASDMETVPRRVESTTRRSTEGRVSRR